MRCVLIKDGIITAIANSATTPTASGWRVVDESFPGKIGDKVSTYGDKLEAKFDSIPSDIAIRVRDEAQKKAADAQERMIKSQKAYDDADRIAKDAMERSAEAVEVRRIAQAEAVAASEAYKEAAHTFEVKKAEADVALNRELEADADAAALKARQEALAKGRKKAEKGASLASGSTSSALGGKKEDKKDPSPLEALRKAVEDLEIFAASDEAGPEDRVEANALLNAARAVKPADMQTLTDRILDFLF